MENKFYGLTELQARASREQHGSNDLTVKKKASFFKKLFQSFCDPIIRILLIALLITVILPGGSGGLFDTIGIAAAIVVSTLVSTLSEYSSERAFRKMQEEASVSRCTVIREGARKSILINEITVGDIVYLTPGDKVPADGYIISGGISCDQSALNGESVEVHKTVGETELSGLGGVSSLYRGSTVTAGSGIMKVCAVGDSTYYGKMAYEVQTESSDSPLRRKLSGLARTLSKFGYFCAACVAVSDLVNAFFLSGDFIFTPANIFFEVIHAVTLAVSIVVVAVPEGLPMMITVVLSSNMLKMQKHKVQVRKPVGIETAGSINILFTDKTGTLTCGTPRASCCVTGDGSKSSRVSDIPDSLRFLYGACAVFASGSSVENINIPSRRRAVGGDGTDRAVLDGYLACGEYPKGLKVSAKLPFDSSRKLTAAYVDLSGAPDKARLYGNSLTFVKGAPEVILSKCRGYYRRDGSVGDIDRNMLLVQLNALMSKGMRVVALAASGAREESIKVMAENAEMNRSFDIDALYSDMNFIGFAGIRDELRRESSGAVKTLKEAGIQVVMITGDSWKTAEAIASECGILDPRRDNLSHAVIDSTELAGMSDDKVMAILPELRVVARALPSDKSRLVRIARSAGNVTAMTGDGINDAPALKQADVGFAMGSGTEVAKEAGDIIITDNNISSIVRAVLYGRTIFRSIRKFVVFQLTMNLCAVGISIIGPFIGCDSPVTVIQMLWINLIMDTLAALAFAGEAPMKRYMKEPPVPMDEPVLSGDMITKIFVMGVFTVMVCLYYYNSAWVRSIFRASENDIYFLSGFFALFVFCGILGAFNARTTRLNLFSGLFVNPVFIFVMCAVFTVQLALIYYGGEVFRCAPLSFRELRSVMLLALTVLPAGRLLEIIQRVGKSSGKRGV